MFKSMLYSLLAVLLVLPTVPLAHADSDWTISGSDMYSAVSGNVGIGTGSPVTALDIAGGSDSLRLRSGSAAVGFSKNQILFSHRGSKNFSHALKSRHNSTSTAGNAIDFFVWDAATDAPGDTGTLQVMTLSGDGYGMVGIGTTNPEDKLHAYSSDAAGNVGYVLENGDRQWRMALRGDTDDVFSIQDDTEGEFRFVIDTSGNVGVGITSPEDRVHVYSSDTEANIGYVMENGDRQWRMGLRGDTDDLFSIQDDTEGEFRFVIDTDGNIGLGTSTPELTLDVLGGASLGLDNNVAARFRVGEGSTGDAGVIFGVENGNAPFIGDDSGSKVTSTGLSFRTGGTNRMKIDADGNVGVGTSSPAYLTEISGDTGSGKNLFAVTDTTNSQTLALGANPTAMSLYNLGSSGLDFGTDNTSRLFIDVDGNVGVGTNSAEDKLHVYSSDSAGNVGYVLENGDRQWRMAVRGDTNDVFSIQDDTEGAFRFVIDADGNVGIGTTSPATELDVAGDIQATGTICDSNGCIGSSGSGSSVWSQSGSDVYYSSGNVGVGTNSPNYDLDVDGDIGVNSTLHGPSSTSLNLQAQEERAIKFYTDGSNERMRITSDGDVGIGTSDPEYPLHVYTTTTTDNDGAIKAKVDASSGNSFSIYALNDSDASSGGSAVGVYGHSTTNDNDGGGVFGVLGRTQVTDDGDHDGDGIPDESSSAGVWGGASGNDDQTSGSHGGLANGVQGETWSTHDSAAGGRFFALTGSSGEADAVYGETDSSDADSYAFLGHGPSGTTGSKSAIVNTASIGPVKLFAVESPEIWFEDIGHARLQNGRAVVSLDSLFLETVTINDEHPMEVFVQPHAAVNLYVIPGEDAFEVVSMGNEGSNASFSYRVMAKRRHYEEDRLTPTKVKIDMFMEPELSIPELKSLNEFWGLYWEDLADHRVPSFE